MSPPQQNVSVVWPIMAVVIVLLHDARCLGLSITPSCLGSGGTKGSPTCGNTHMVDFRAACLLLALHVPQIPILHFAAVIHCSN
jgi:hypothetical protein